MRFRKASIEIKGVRPLWLHAFTIEALPLERKEQTGKAGHDPEEWRRTVLTTKDGQLYLPTSYVFGCLRDGSRNIKDKRASIMPKVTATLQVLGDKLLIPDRFLPGPLDSLKTSSFTRDEKEPVYLDVRSVKNPSTRARNIRSRVACSPGWELSFEIIWDVTIINEAQMEAVINDAGDLVGIGDGRSMGMGRFKKISWEVQKVGGTSIA